MAGQQPERKFAPIRLGGVLDESMTPNALGGNPAGLTACQNLVYRRFGAWGKRAGTTIVYAAVAPATPPVVPTPPSGGYTPAPSSPPNPPPSPPGAPVSKPNPAPGQPKGL